jgi:hypothetical protein
MSKMKGKLQTLLCIGGRNWQLSRKVIPAHAVAAHKQKIYENSSE